MACTVPWCDGRHDVLYQVAREPSARDHFREIGRVNDGGTTEIVVGIAATRDTGDDWHDPCVELIHLDLIEPGGEARQLACGDAYLTPAEALALAPLLTRAAEILTRWQTTAPSTT